MTTWLNDPRSLGLAEGTVATPGNTAAPNAFDPATSSGTVTFRNPGGVYGKHWEMTGSIARGDVAISGMSAGVMFECDLTGSDFTVADSGVIRLYQATGQTTPGLSLMIESNLFVRAYNAAGTPVWTSPTALPAGTTRFRGFLGATAGTTASNGTIRAKVWFGANVTSTLTTPDFDSGAVTGVNAGTTAFTSGRFGKLTSTSAAVVRHLWARGSDTSNDTTGYAVPAAPSSNVAPVVNAGADQSAIEPWSSVTLTATVTDSDGTATITDWSQTAGTPTVTLAGSGASRTFAAPAVSAGTTLTFTATGTDNDGATATDSVSVTMLPAAERLLIGGTWTPARLTLAPAAPPPGPDVPPVDPEPPVDPDVPAPSSAVLVPRQPVFHTWTMWARTPGYVLSSDLPIISAQITLKWLDVDKAVITTPYSETAYAALQPPNGVVLFRDGRQEFTGLVGPLELTWDGETGQAIIRAECDGDAVHLKDRPVFPDPLRAADDQSVNNYWRARDAGGTPAAVIASTAMRQLISDQAGATALAARRVTGLTLGPDPAVGISRGWNGLFARDASVLGLLTVMSVASGANLGIRTFTSPGVLRFDVVAPRDQSQAVKFSVEFGDVAAITYRIEPPTVTHALVAGQGDLHLRVRKLVATTSAFARSWGRQIWSVIDRRDTADADDMLKAGQDAITDGDATVSLSVTLLDSDAARYGTDWQLGDRVAVFVRLPGQDGPVATVTDVVREIAITVDDKGVESIRPAIGTYDAKATIPTPSQKALVAVRDSVAGLIANK